MELSLFFKFLRRSPKDDAGQRLASLALRLRSAADEAETDHAIILRDMAGHLERIRNEVEADMQDRALTRSFRHHAGVIVKLAERFVALSGRARVEQRDRVDALADQMRDYRALFARVERACLENDFDDMEATIAALDIQLNRLSL